MTPFQSSGATVLAINGQLFGATITGALAVWLWPDTPQGWAFGLLSILLGAASFSAIINAVKAAVKLYQRDKALSQYLAQGAKPKTAQMASSDALRNAGMIDG